MGRLFAAVRAGLVTVLLLCASPGMAQPLGGSFDTGIVRSPLLVIDFERFFAESAFGRQVNTEIEAQGAALAAENRRIEAELTEEEQRLTDQRAEMDPPAFRALADAFDEKVQRLRAEQDAKAAALGARSDERRRAFLAVAQPVLEALMREANAAVILERRSVFVAADAIDITDLAITRVDERLSPEDEVPPVEAPDPDEGAAILPLPAPDPGESADPGTE